MSLTQTILPKSDVLLVALSARALAGSAGRSGMSVTALDLFADTDTEAMANRCFALPSRRLRLPGPALGRVLAAPDLRGVPLVYGAGFEDRPDLLEALERDRPVIGNSAATVAMLKDPSALAALLGRLGIPHPDIATSPPVDSGGWLTKHAGASGGGHIRPAGRRVPAGHYLQRRVPGRPVSLLFLADGRRVLPVGFSRQWVAPAPRQPFRYGGAVGPLPVVPIDRGAAAGMTAAVSRITAEVGLVGLNSADFLAGPGGWCLLEINPRPGATLDLFDRPPMPGLLGLHMAACSGDLPQELPALSGCRAALVVYARTPVRLDGGMRWPDWTADRPRSPAHVLPGAPFCTVLADAAGVVEARRLAGRRARDLFRLHALAAAA
ncbi:ATP-grasp domain-containing protein [Azospirillum humicireducens]|uniref:ATP-grasp domain-containing protein n=1 Tax=Azospirillum humicireducens TaxID=1226968 RepID=UPI001F019C39|nr:ATP-grasp domain-containing protein [Azospirillum humicireducens]